MEQINTKTNTKQAWQTKLVEQQIDEGGTDKTL